MSFTYNNIKKDFIEINYSETRPGIAPVEHTLLQVKGHPGAYVSDTNLGVRKLTVPINIFYDDYEDFQKKKEELAEWLYQKEPRELIFDDEPDRVYYALFNGELNFEEHRTFAFSTLEFICPDPYKYGPEKTVEPSSDTFIVENNGTAEAEPIFTLQVRKPTTFAMISNGDEYMMVGRPADAIEVPTNTRPIILNDNASTLVGWSTFPGGFNFFNMGLVGGAMEVHDGYAFRPASYGTNPNGWTGPAIRKSLSEPLQDFEIEIDIAMLNNMTGVGRIVLVGLDASDKPVFAMQMVDPTDSYANNRADFRLGDNLDAWFNYQGDAGKKVWNDGRFLLRISRQGQEFKARVARRLEGYQQTGRHARTFIDTKNEYQNPITQVAIYMARARSFMNVGMLFHHLTVRKLVNLADYEVPYIAFPEDEIVFNHKTGDCYINGDPVPFDFGADFFKLKKGENSLAVMPENTFETSVKYLERYK